MNEGLDAFNDDPGFDSRYFPTTLNYWNRYIVPCLYPPPPL